MDFYFKSDKPPKAQSKQFGETQNTHTELNVSDEKWDKIFHNYEDPEKCAGRKRPGGCSICNKIINDNHLKNND